MKTTISLSASSCRIRSTYLSRNCPQISLHRLSKLGQDLLGGLFFGATLAVLLLLLLL